MRFRIIFLLLCFFPLSAFSQPGTMVDKAMEEYVPAEKYIYNWRDAVLLKSFTDVWRGQPDKREQIEKYICTVMNRVAPSAHGKHPNGIASAVGFAFLKEIGLNTPETDAAEKRVWNDYLRIPRSGNGACSHRAGTLELWDDTLYMLEIYLLGMYKATGDTKYLNCISGEIKSHAEHLRDPRSGFWYHGWAAGSFPTNDELCVYGWNSNPLHRSSEFWGRGNGWISMTLCDVLDCMPKEHSDYPVIKEMFLSMARSLKKYQDRRSGMWYQLCALPKEKGNYVETSCSAMFAYSLAKGVRIGVLSKSYLKLAQKAYQTLCINPDSGICEGTCIGDREYYLGRKVKSGETYSLGAYIMLENELINK